MRHKKSRKHAAAEEIRAKKFVAPESGATEGLRARMQRMAEGQGPAEGQAPVDAASEARKLFGPDAVAEGGEPIPHQPGNKAKTRAKSDRVSSENYKGPSGSGSKLAEGQKLYSPEREGDVQQLSPTSLKSRELKDAQGDDDRKRHEGTGKLRRGGDSVRPL